MPIIILTFADDDYDLYVNGTLVRSNWDGWASEIPNQDDISSLVQSGDNVVAIKARDTAGTCQSIAFDISFGFGSISGTVFDVSGNTIPDAQVCTTYSSWEWVNCTYTDTNGNYIIGGLSAGTYRIGVRAINGQSGYYNDTQDWNTASWITVNSGEVTTGIDLMFMPAGSISGVVYDAFGNTVPDAQVCTVDYDPYADTFSYANCTMTNVTGNYIMGGLPAGNYRLSIDINNWDIEEFYNSTYDWNMSSWVTVNAGETTTDIDFHLLHGGGRISGYVSDFGGDGIQVCAVEYDQGTLEECVNPNWFWRYGYYGGYYVIDGLPDGDYKVDLRPLPDTGMAQEYFDHVFNPQYASRVFVTAGQTTADINFDLLGLGIVWGTITDSKLNPIPNATVCAYEYESNRLSNCAQSASDGTYRMELGGYRQYRITVQADGWLPENYSESADPMLPVDLTVEGSEANFVLESSYSIETYIFNLDNPILNEIAVRQAISYGIDRQRILNEAFLPNNIYGVVLDSYVPPGNWAQAPSSALVVYPFDPDSARAVLEAAGWVDSDGDGVREKDGQSLSFDFQVPASQARAVAAEIFRQNMADIGVEIFVTMIWDYNFYWNLYYSLSLEGIGIDIAEFSWDWCTDPNDEACNPPSIWNSGDAENYGGYSNPAIDYEYAAAHSAATPEEKLPHIIQHQAIISQDLPMLPLFTRVSVLPIPTPTGSNVSVSPESYVNITFSDVTGVGVTTAIATGANPADLPHGFQLIDTVYEIGTNATFTHAQICFTYDDGGLTPSQESSIRLFHLENNTWVDVTDSDYPDTTVNRVCGTVSSFSPFAIMYTLNGPPAITAITAPVDPIQIGQSITATTTFNDPNAGDIHSAVWEWGDGSTTSALALPPTASASHTYSTPGVYTVTVTITDAAGESATATFQYVVIYDPNGGFVTGGGWINSPAGAYTPDPSLTGKATFGFVSKYQKGANVPTGNTEFQFKVANLNFKSTSYQWLVIAGSKAQFKGVGTINGAGEYGFMLTAIDGSPDKFRIKIWDMATGEIVYDNMLGAADTDDPITAIGGGSIVIHKEK